MLLRNLHTGEICTEEDLVIHWEMDMTYNYLNRDLEDDDEDDWDDDEDDKDEDEPEMTSFSEWLKEMVEDGDYEIVE